MTMKGSLVLMAAIDALLSQKFGSAKTTYDTHHVKSKMADRKYSKRKKALRLAKKSKSKNRK